MTARLQEVTGDALEVAFVEQGYTGNQAAQAAEAHGSHPELVTLPEVMHGFVLLPRPCVVEPNLAWAARFRRFAPDSERLPETLAGLHSLLFTILMPTCFVTPMVQSA